MSEQPLYTNRLIKEKSPYLQQHAHNPVDWYPWGEEALSAAKEQDKPIFLSIGYATCHWCHVMEKESFEDEEIAKLLNDAFINVKVDREEHPELDSLYMEFAQTMIAGNIGWPLNVILTPALQPFFAATYLPAKSNHGLAGLAELIPGIQEAWNGEERENLVEQAQEIVRVFAENVHTKGDELPGKEQIGNTAEILFKIGDSVHGGINGAPKFPIGYQWNFLIRYASLADDGRSLFLAERTLDMMYRGGIHDHLGGGFSRYSVDERWLVPHFEKMLYDNALVIFSYLEAWQLTKRPHYKAICEETLNYILRDMTHPEGGFYSAEDADSEGHEGYFYTWTYQEVVDILGREQAALFCEFYDITPHGNFERRNILNTPIPLEPFALKKGIDSKVLSTLFNQQRKTLWEVRQKRIPPFKDDKILSSWNGLMIASMAEAGAAFDNKEYIQGAERAASFIKKYMWDKGHLFRRWRDGEALFNAALDEYAFLIKGLISLYEVSGSTEWLDWAIGMTAILRDQFKSEEGAFYQTDGYDENIILRKCQFSDGAEPSGNAIHCENLLRLYHLTNETDYLEQAEDILKASKEYVDSYSPGYCYHIMNLMRYYAKDTVTAVIALNATDTDRDQLRSLFYQQFIPYRSIIWKAHEDQRICQLIPFLRKQVSINDKTTLYLCRQEECLEPLTSLSEMTETIHDL